MNALSRLLLHPDLYVDPDDWRILRTLGIYRLVLVLLLIGLHLAGYSPYFFDQIHGSDFLAVGLGYLSAAILLVPPLLKQLPRLSVQAHLCLLVDGVAIVCLVAATGGVTGGLGVLLITPLVCGSLVLSARMALLHAALSTLLMFGEELWRQSRLTFMPNELTTTGLLGLMLFGVALAASVVANRARRSGALAARAGNDLATLTRLNERIVDSMETGALVLDEARRVQLVNVAARRLLGVTNDIVGQPLSDFSAALAEAFEHWDSGAASAMPTVAAGPSQLELIPRFTRLGATQWSPVLVQLEDSSRMRDTAQQMKLAALGRLSAGVAHEIRNPLSAIHHAGQLLAESPKLDAEERRLLDMIHRHSVRIDKIVEDVLDLSRREVGSPSPIPLREFLENSVITYREGCPQEDRRIQLVSMPDDLVVRFDPGQLQQVLHNLWDNSFKHGARADGGAIRVQLSGGRLSPGRRPYLEVADDGRGIPPEMRERIFEPFVTGAHHGTGLGLYLARELCEYNQARLVQHARPEAGAAFRIIFAAA